MTEYDSPWKEAIDAFFERFMAICFPSVHSAVDWNSPVKMLDKELQQIAPLGEIGLRIVDKLVEVRLLNGEIEWILIHLEVQTQVTPDFPTRLFVCFYRIRDKYNQRVVSLAVLGDTNPNWRPDRYTEETLSCKIEFQFPIVKLLDFSNKIEALEQSDNPFASVILAHLGSIKTKDVATDRY